MHDNVRVLPEDRLSKHNKHTLSDSIESRPPKLSSIVFSSIVLLSGFSRFERACSETLVTDFCDAAVGFNPTLVEVVNALRSPTATHVRL